VSRSTGGRSISDERRGIENAVLGFDGIYGKALLSRFTGAIRSGGCQKKYRATIHRRTISFGTLVVIELSQTETIIGERQDFSVPSR
jgi:hypothetical protein